MQKYSKRMLLGTLLAVGLIFLSLPVAAQVTLPSFTDVPITGPAYINSAITAAAGTTGINVPAACPGSLVNLNLDGVVVQTIQVNNNLPGSANLILDFIETQNLGSLPGPNLNATNGLVFFGVTDSGATYCISNTPAVSGGTAPFLATAGPGLAIAIPAGISYINVAVQLQVANSTTYTSNVNGQTINLRTRLTYTTQLGGVNFVQHSSAVTTAGTTFAVSLGGLETVDNLGTSPSGTAQVTSNPTITQTVDLTHNSQNVGVTTDIVDICVKNQGSALADQDIQAIDVFDAFGHLLASQPGSVLASAVSCQGATTTGTFNGSGGGAGFGVSLNRGVIPGTPATWTNYLIPNGSTSRFQIVVRLRNTAISGRTVRLQTTFVTAVATTSLGALTVGTNAQLINPGALPSVVMRSPVTLSNGSGILRVGDANVLQPVAGRANLATTTVPISVSNFPSPGFGGFSGVLSYDPSVISIANGCNGITGAKAQSPSVGFTYQYKVSCFKVNDGSGKATFSVYFDSGTPVTSGENPVVNVSFISAPGATAGESSQISLSLFSVSDFSGVSVTTSTSPGVLTIKPMGDVNEDGTVGIADAIMLANAIVACLTAPTHSLGLSVTQLEEADVAAPFATPASPPAFAASDFRCVDTTLPDGKVLKANIDSKDVAAIGRLALSGASVNSLAVQPQPIRALQLRALNVRGLAFGAGMRISAQGNGITGLELAVYDLSGRLIATQQAAGNRLTFRALASNGQRLANGVYLYTVTVRGANGQTVRTEVRKLVVLR